ncbi:MAG TPA: heme-binding protein, partial [Vicinamibacteria bacterium]|nr:heme-binding protein [Vicinamibacteria bacterium]
MSIPGRAGLLLAAALLPPAAEVRAQELAAAEVRGIVERAAAEAQRRGGRAAVAVVDAEGTPLAVFRMGGAAP